MTRRRLALPRCLAAGALATLWLSGCAHVQSAPLSQTLDAVRETHEVPGATDSSAPGLRRYRDALRAGDLPAAYALTSEAYRKTHAFPAFSAALTTPAARTARAHEVDAALTALAHALPECVGGALEPVQAASLTLRQFLDAADRHDFVAAHGLLTSPWRNVYTPERLQADFQRAHGVGTRLQQARASLDAGLATVEPNGSVQFSVDLLRGVLLVREAEGYRVAALGD